MMPVAQRNPVLSANKSKTLAQLKQKMLKMLNDPALQLGFAIMVQLRYFQEIQYIRVADNIFGPGNRLPLLCQV